MWRNLNSEITWICLPCWIGLPIPHNRVSQQKFHFQFRTNIWKNTKYERWRLTNAVKIDEWGVDRRTRYRCAYLKTAPITGSISLLRILYGSSLRSRDCGAAKATPKRHKAMSCGRMQRLSSKAHFHVHFTNRHYSSCRSLIYLSVLK